MINYTSVDDAMRHLQGDWISDKDSRTAFSIKGNKLQDITGLGEDINESEFSLTWDSAKDMFTIDNELVFGAWRNPIFFYDDKFVVMDMSWPPKELRAFLRKDGYHPAT